MSPEEQIKLAGTYVEVFSKLLKQMDANLCFDHKNKGGCDHQGCYQVADLIRFALKEMNNGESEH